MTCTRQWLTSFAIWSGVDLHVLLVEIAIYQVSSNTHHRYQGVNAAFNYLRKKNNNKQKKKNHVRKEKEKMVKTVLAINPSSINYNDLSTKIQNVCYYLERID